MFLHLQDFSVIWIIGVWIYLIAFALLYENAEESIAEKGRSQQNDTLLR